MSTSPLTQQFPPSPHPQRNPAIADFNFPPGLPTAEELPDSDDRPVDSELQELIPGLLKLILLDHWRDRPNWLFGIDLGFYYDPEQPCIPPDGLLSLGVTEPVDENLRPSYVLWQENVIPLLALEIVSKAYRREHTQKLAIYQSIGILYYVVYAPLRKRQAKLQIYKLVNGVYELQSHGESPYWLPEIGLALGAERGRYGNRDREWLYWYDSEGHRLPTPMERADAAEQRVQALLAQLQALGVDVDHL